MFSRQRIRSSARAAYEKVTGPPARARRRSASSVSAVIMMMGVQDAAVGHGPVILGR